MRLLGIHQSTIKMKITTLLPFLLAISITVTGCCQMDDDCAENSAPECFDQVPQDELCDAYFERWFYSEADNACTKIAYSGCSMRGFETEEACSECQCIDPVTD